MKPIFYIFTIAPLRVAVIFLFLSNFDNLAFAAEIKLFVGFDARQPIGTSVFEYSVNKYSSKFIAYHVLDEKLLKSKGLLPEHWDKNQLSGFGRSRFLVPYLSNYEGWSIFVDGTDMLMREDIAKLWNLKDDQYTVMVVKHPSFKQEHSALGRSISPYEMFNWSSVMLFNNEKCKNLTPEYVFNAPYLDLHRFQWIDSPTQIGKLPKEWNHLVGYYSYDENTALVHWTLGAPHLGEKFKKADYANEWFELAAEMLGTKTTQVEQIY